MFFVMTHGKRPSTTICTAKHLCLASKPVHRKKLIPAHFSRNITNRIGAMRSFGSLDLSRNNLLSWKIPANLSNLTFLFVMRIQIDIS
jgi:hypothetical protein